MNIRVGKYPDNPVWAVFIQGDFGYQTDIPVAVFTDIVYAAGFANQIGVKCCIEVVDKDSVIIRDYKINTPFIGGSW